MYLYVFKQMHYHIYIYIDVIYFCSSLRLMYAYKQIYCVFVYIMYKCVRPCTYLGISISIFLYCSISSNMYLCWIYIWLSLVHLYKYIYTSIYLYIHTCMYKCIYTYMCICIYIHIYICVYIYIHIFIFISIYTHTYLWTYTYVCIFSTLTYTVSTYSYLCI
jgi:hypothetical protein